MKALIGIDTGKSYVGAMSLLARLKFPGLQAHLLHVVDPPTDFGVWPILAETLPIQSSEEEAVLREAQQTARIAGLQVDDSCLLAGIPPSVLAEYAEGEYADLVCIGSTHRSPLSRFWLDGVGRSLAIRSKRSILISKENGPTSGPVTAIIATDHSTCADEAIAMLARMKPAGLERVVLVTALDKDLMEGTDEAEHEDVRSFMVHKSVKTVKHLNEAGMPADYIVFDGDVRSVVDWAMKLENADLLIIGSHCRGFLDRLVNGSESLSEVVASSYNIMILRP